MLQANKITEPGLYADTGSVPLKGVSISVEVLDAASCVTVAQRFKNEGSKPLETTYCFPLEESSAVYRFEALMGDRVIKGFVEERDKAFEEYDKAIARGDGAVLLDQEQTNIFVASLGNLMPEQEAIISISYATELPVSDDLIRLMIPTTVSPHYTPAGYDPVKADVINPPLGMSVPYGLTLSVTILDAESVAEVSSPSHDILINKERKSWSITLKNGETTLNRDFILYIKHKDPKSPFAIIQEHENGDKVIMIRLYPEFDANEEREPGEIIFVLDCSGSMQGSSVEQAKKVLELCLRSMPVGDKFNIICFGSSHESLFSEPQEYTEKTFEQALQYVRRIDADLGGTELYPALKKALANSATHSELHKNIFVITDGEIANVEEVIELARSHRDTARIFSFGIGYGASHSLVRGLARVTNGMDEFVSPDERIEEKVLRQFSRLDTPHIKNIKIEWDGLIVKQAPALIPPIFNGDSFTVYGLIESGSSTEAIKLSGKVGNEDISWIAPIINQGQGYLIPTLWARHSIQDLETGNFLETGSRQSSRKSRVIKQKIIDTAKRYQIMSSETSFVGIETRSDADRATEAPVFRRVPIQLTKDWHGVKYDLALNNNIKLNTRKMNKAAPIISEFCDDAQWDIPTFIRQSTEDDGTKSYDHRVEIKEDLSKFWFYELLLTQAANGWFALTEKLAEQVSNTLEDLKKIAASIDGVKKESTRENILATAITILVLEIKASEHSNQWSAAVKKAKKIINMQAKKASLDGKPLLERAKEIFFPNV